ncbi:MAG: four helix bundle suffix domain-containing protein [Candidatus Hydrogenedentes bacterium]|nr:four helix bundle suffix domain-containing protein [Candidatus Hydrogenedentota bacterium]
MRSFQVAQDIYDATVVFCERFIDKKSRTHDQMIQAGRSGVQNIVEGSVASATSKKMEIKLTGVAKASLEELLRDYEDYLRQNGLRKWDKDSPEAKRVREMYKLEKSDRSDQSERSDESDRLERYGIRTGSAELVANTLICLIHQATYLLRRQLERLEQEFLEKGGFTERMYWERKRWRDKEKE